MSRRFFTHWLPLLIWMALIFSASTQLGAPNNTSRIVRPLLLWLDPGISEGRIAQIHYGVRKSAHATEYAILGILIWRLICAFKKCHSISLGAKWGIAVLCAGLYAASDETHQLFVKGREGSVRDVLLDTAGAAVGVALITFDARRRKAS